MPPPKSKALQQAQVTMQEELTKQLGEKAKSIFDKIERMKEDGKGRDEIEKMMADEIATYTRANLLDLAVLIT